MALRQNVSFRTSSLSWCGNLHRIPGSSSSSIRRGRVSRPPEFRDSYGAGRETRPLRCFYGWSDKFRFVAPQNDTERVRVKTITDHVRHDLAARPAGKFQFAAPQNDTERVRQETKTDHVRHDLSAATRRQIPIYLLAGGKPNAYSKIKPAGEPWLSGRFWPFRGRVILC